MNKLAVALVNLALIGGTIALCCACKHSSLHGIAVFLAAWPWLFFIKTFEHKNG